MYCYVYIPPHIIHADRKEVNIVAQRQTITFRDDVLDWMRFTTAAHDKTITDYINDLIRNDYRRAKQYERDAFAEFRQAKLRIEKEEK